MTDQAGPSGSTFPTRSNTNTSGSDLTVENQIATLVAKYPVVIFCTYREFDTCHALGQVFQSLGVIPKVYDLGQHPWGKEVKRALIEKNGPIPVVYIHGELFGNSAQVMISHVEGKMAELIKDPTTAEDRIKSLVAENKVVIFSMSKNFAECETLKSMFSKLVITPKVYELDQYPWGKEVETALIEKNGTMPVVYIGGQLVGNLTQVIDIHMKGHLELLIK